MSQMIYRVYFKAKERYVIKSNFSQFLFPSNNGNGSAS